MSNKNHTPDATATPAPTKAATPSPSPSPTPTPIPTPSPSQIPITEWEIQRESAEDTGNYRDEMKWWVIDIAQKARETDEDFIIIPQNCTGLFPTLGDTNMNLDNYFLNTVSGIGNESLVYGVNGYGALNAEDEIMYTAEALLPALSLSKPVLSIDYCKTEKAVHNSQKINQQLGYLSYQAPQRELSTIPENINFSNNRDVETLSDAENFLILLNPVKFRTRAKYIEALSSTMYDVIIIDCYFNDGKTLTPEEVAALKTKPDGGKRLVISYLSIGEAEDYRPYWQSSYNANLPEWILKENPNWKGNYPVYYWHDEWRDIIAMGENSYLNIIQNVGFDGVYLDIVDGYMHFE